ncbi:type IV toxin-antitoxin system AbiEi family antitoxin domain-containing protein [Fodinibius sp. AD559]|uniref:type IV toxin-antitoxin system AbiEi family antitoxin domain-containing protein n=1 Tax=Fodinibius sp. AD559 TaxID=3424179 RepID=UPI004046A57C
MSTAKKIKEKVSSFDEGTTFKYDQLGIDNSEYGAATKAIERMVSKGLVKRISRGLFYNPKKSSFGDLKPNEDQLLKPYMYEGDNRIAYITGLSLYNRLGLTTQVPSTVTLACNKKRINTEIDNLKIKSVKSYVDPTDENIHLLEILDAIKDFKKIPDLNIDNAIGQLQGRISDLSTTNRNKLITYALQYPPRVRALLGALLTDQEYNNAFPKLKNSLNPLSSYEFGSLSSSLSTAQNWNIV